MQRKLTFEHRSEDEEIKEAGFNLDFDEIARKGVMSKEETSIAKWYGIYASQHPGNYMARVVISGGLITSQQARCIATTANKYAQGNINVTTRQALQFHWLKVGHLADMMRELSKTHLTTFHGCGDVTRIVTACSLAETCKYARFDVRKFAIATQKYLGGFRDLDDLPRKFKITYSGCETACAQPYINCVGAIAQVAEINGEQKFGFKVVIGGGMGWKPFVAQELFSFVPQDQILEVSRAIALLFRDHGDRFNRAKSRLKFVVDRLGIDACREIVLENLKAGDKQTNNLQVNAIKETGIPFPKRIKAEDFIAADGTHTVGVKIPKGELNYKQLNSLAELSEEFGNQRLYTTNRQNIEFKGVEPKNTAPLRAKINELGFEPDEFFTIKDVVSCVGSTYCPKAITETRSLFDKIQPIISQQKYSEIKENVLINITGCPNSCSQYRITDIGFRGMRIREELGSSEAYEMLIGGSQTSFGQLLGEFKEQDCVEILDSVLNHYITNKTVEESLTETVQRIGLDSFKKAIGYEV
jgi:ferredoxin-nitrite reductase